jgi:hypothetical protein
LILSWQEENCVRKKTALIKKKQGGRKKLKQMTNQIIPKLPENLWKFKNKMLSALDKLNLLGGD